MTTATLNPSADTYITTTSVTANYNTSTILGVGKSTYNNHSLLTFDFSSLPINAVVQSAKLRLTLQGIVNSGAGTIRAYRTKRAVNITQATWNIYSTGNNWQTAGGFGADDCEQTDIGSTAYTAADVVGNIREIVLSNAAIQEMISGAFANNGLLLKTDEATNDQRNYYSANNTSNKPELVLDYVVAGRQFQAVWMG